MYVCVRIQNRARILTDLPLLVADCGYLRDSLSDDVLPFLVAYVKPYRVYFATAVDLKGAEPHRCSTFTEAAN